MLLKQYYLGCLAHASYLIADEQTGTAVVVDPQRDIDQYVQDAAQHGVQIRYVFLTHFHADFLAGHLELRDRAGATISSGGPDEGRTHALRGTVKGSARFFSRPMGQAVE
jgi:hydroxyacylglutathione hydrolase